jgi:hypothetical protein
MPIKTQMKSFFLAWHAQTTIFDQLFVFKTLQGLPQLFSWVGSWTLAASSVSDLIGL